MLNIINFSHFSKPTSVAFKILFQQFFYPRMDNASFNDNLSTYVLMNKIGMGILEMVVIDKREVGLKNPKIEKEGD